MVSPGRHRPGRARRLEPEKGANALVALAALIGQASAVARPGRGTTVTPTVAAAGTAANVVPAEAFAEVDVRVAEPAEADRVDAGLRALTTAVAGTTVTVTGGPNRPPLPRQATAALFALAQAAADDLGLGRSARPRSAAAQTATSPPRPAARLSTAWARSAMARTLRANSADRRDARAGGAADRADRPHPRGRRSPAVIRRGCRRPDPAISVTAMRTGRTGRAAGVADPRPTGQRR